MTFPFVPILVCIPQANKLAQELERKLQDRGFLPTMVAFSRLPDVATAAKNHAAVVAFADLAIASQIKRAKQLADAANIPLIELRRQAAEWEVRIATHIAPVGVTRDELLVFLASQLDRPVGWFAPHLNHPALGTIPSSVKDAETFAQYLDRLPPDDLPPSLRGRFGKGSTKRTADVPKPAPSNPAPVPEVPPPPPVPAPVSTVPSEEYALLKEEYDQLVFKHQETVASYFSEKTAREEATTSAQNLQRTVVELSEEIARLQGQLQEVVTPEALRKLSAEWKEEGRKELRHEYEAAIASLRLQIETLQANLTTADEELTAAVEENTKLKEELASKPKGRNPAISTPAVQVVDLLRAVRVLTEEGWSDKAALQWLFERFKL